MVERPGLRPYSLQLTLKNAAASISDSWQRIYVSAPSIIYPYKPSEVPPQVIGSADILYAPDGPLTSVGGYPEFEDAVAPFRGYATGRRGAAYLWKAGEWWVFARGQQAGVDIALPFWVIPCPDPEYANHLLQGNVLGPTRPPNVVRTAHAVGGNTNVVAVQDILDGVTAVELYPASVNALLSFRWSNAGGALVPMALGIPYRFTGPTLPLADLYINNGTAAIVVVTRILYY